MLKQSLVVGLICTMLPFWGFAQQVSTAADLPFRAGEWFEFRIHYGWFNASYATLKLSNDTLNQQPVLHAAGIGKTTGLARLFFRVDDYYDTFFDPKTVLPRKFLRNIDEGGYTKNTEIHFDHQQGIAHVNDKKKKVQENFDIRPTTQDLMSAFYYLRTFYPQEGLTVGDSYALDMFFDKENYVFKLKFLGTESLRTKFGLVSCLKFRPIVQAGRVFREEESVTLWVSNDQNRIPIRLQADLAVGSIKADLNNFSYLKYPFQLQIDK